MLQWQQVDLDAIPAVVELFGDVGKDAGLPPTDLDPVFQAAPLLNVENYLRELSLLDGSDENIPEEHKRR